MQNSYNHTRFREILHVLRKHEIIKGLSPVKLREIIEDLGPTYIKLGQILSMRSDILPREYCLELAELRSNVAPMPFSQVVQMLEEAYGQPVSDVFYSLEEQPLGSASIAQVHKAVLMNGESVVVKVQRPNIYNIMSKDIAMLHKGVRFLRYTSALGAVDFEEVLNEMWSVAQEEMNFMMEAANMQEFQRLNKDIVYIAAPKLYPEYTTSNVLVMEYIDGYGVDQKKELVDDGYDLNEIGRKMVYNYVKQIMEDGFFHADPHPGNIRIRDGKIVWIDMGMMGRFNNHECTVLKDLIGGIADNDVDRVKDAVLSIGIIVGKLDHHQIFMDINEILVKYMSMELSNMNISNIMDDILDAMTRNNIKIPSSLVMLVRGLVTIEGVIAVLSPEINIIEIASASMKGQFWKDFDLVEELKKDSKTIYSSVKKTMELPKRLSDILKMFTKGESRLNLDIHTTEDLSTMLNSLVQDIVIGLVTAAFLMASSILCTTNMKPQIIGIPLLGFVGYVASVILLIRLFINYVKRNRERKNHNKKHRVR